MPNQKNVHSVGGAPIFTFSPNPMANPNPITNPNAIINPNPMPNPITSPITNPMANSIANPNSTPPSFPMEHIPSIPFPSQNHMNGFYSNPMGFGIQHPFINQHMPFEMYAAQYTYNLHYTLLNNFYNDVNNIKTILSNEISQVFKRNEDLRAQQDAICIKVIQRLEECVKTVSPKCKLQAFGSYKTKLMIPGSDIDVHISLGQEIPSNKKDIRRNAEYFQQIIDFLRSLQKEIASKLATSEIQLIEKTTVPVLKYEDSKFRQKVDVSVNSENALKAVEVIHNFSKQYEQFKFLAIIVKSFLKQKNLNDVYTGGLSSYAICLLVVSFLQMTEKEVKGKDPLETLDRIPLGHLLVDFFSFYGNRFNYDRIGIDVTNGGQYIDLKKRDSQNGRHSPIPHPFEQNPILNIMVTQTPSPMGVKLYLIDPNDSSNIVTKSTYRMNDIINAFSEAFFLLISTPSGNSPLQRIIGSDFAFLKNEKKNERQIKQPQKQLADHHEKRSSRKKDQNGVQSRENTIQEKEFIEHSSGNESEKIIHQLQRDIEELREKNYQLVLENQTRKSAINEKNLKKEQDNESIMQLQQTIEKQRKEIETLLTKQKSDSQTILDCKVALKESRTNYEKLSLKNKRLEEENRNYKLKITELKEKFQRSEKIREINQINRSKGALSNSVSSRSFEQGKKQSNNQNLNSEPNQSLDIFNAIKSGDLAHVKQILSDPKFNVNTCDENYYSPLHLSLRIMEDNIKKAYISNPEISIQLLKFGATPDLYINQVQVSDLTLACSTRHFDLIETLVQCGADLNYSSETSPPPMFVVIENRYKHPNNIEIIKFLVKQPSLNIYGLYNGTSILTYTIQFGRLDVIQAILESQPNAEAREKILHSKHTAYKLNLLMLSCIEKNFEIAKYLLDSNIDPNDRSGKDDSTAFSLLWEWFDDPYELSFLILENKYGYQISMGDIQLVKSKGAFNFAALLEQRYSEGDENVKHDGVSFSQNVDSISISSSNITPRDSDTDSSEETFPDIIFSDNIRKESSIQRVKNIPTKNKENSIRINNFVSSQDTNPLQNNTTNYSLSDSDKKNINEKSNKSENQKKKDKKKKKSTKTTHVETVEESLIKKLPEMKSITDQQKIHTIIEAGEVNVNFKNIYDNNNTFLHYLAELGYYVPIDAVCKRDVNINALNSKKETPLIVAGKKLIEAAKAKDKSRATVYNVVIKYLLKCNPDTYLTDENKDTILHLVCKAGSIEATKYLLGEKSPPLNAQNKDMQTPLHIIIANQGEVKLTDKEICKFLDLFLNIADLDTTLRDKYNRNYLTLAIDMQNVSACMKLLDRAHIEHKISPPKDDSSKERKEKIPLLLYAIQKRRALDESGDTIIKLLLNRNDIDPNAHYMGKNIFAHALESETEDLCLLLLEHCPTIKVSKDAIKIATERKFFEVSRQLKAKKKNKKRSSKDGPTYEGYQRLDDDDYIYSTRERCPVGVYGSSIYHNINCGESTV